MFSFFAKCTIYDNLKTLYIPCLYSVSNCVLFYCLQQYTLENETIQSLALKLGCQAKCVCNDLKVHDKKKGEKLPMEVLSGIANTMGHVKSLVSWFDR